MKKFTKETKLSETLKEEKARKILAKYNLPCLTCPFLKTEIEKLTLGQVCELYDIDIERLLKELNEKLAKK